jgi:hypothetical protein
LRGGDGDSAFGEAGRRGPPVGRDARRNALAFYALAAVVGVLASGLSFAEFLTSRFDRIAGNFGDARLIIYLHEHWYNVYRGREAWLSPPFFFPVKHVLAYSHTLFLQSLPYSLLRLAGLDRYVAFEATLLLFAWVGYVSTIGLLRQLGLRRGFAILGAVLFVYSNLFHIWILAPQIYTIMLVPLVLLGVAKAVAGGSLHRARTLLLLSAAGIACSSILFSDFYTGWFFGFFALMAGGLAISTHRQFRSCCIDFARDHWPSLSAALLAAALALVPFMITYGPAIVDRQGRSFNEVMRFTLPYADMVNVNTGNLVWGRLLGRIDTGYANLGRAFGLPPGLLCCFVVAVELVLARKRVLPWERSDVRYALASRSAVAVLLVWALMFRTRDASLWHMVWHRVPGASAIRATARFQYLLSLAVVVVVVAALSAAWDAASRRIVPGRPLRRVMALGSIAVLSACLLLEQVSLVKTHGISRREEQARLGVIPAPPFACESFCLLETPSPRLNGIAMQIDAMLVSQRVAVPTIHGYSGFNPPGWNLANPAAPDFLDWVERWVSAHHLRQPCALHLSRRTWIADPLADRRAAGMGSRSPQPLPAGPADLGRPR